ncbi:MAG: HAD hydrolase family protein [Muribaculaceae bacterium]|nr:HAD hydrolase family protein [Muribaculaceae bacterium]
MSKIGHDLKTINGVVFDVDGVLSPSTIPLDTDGVPRRMVNIKDGYALQLAAKCGLKMAIISGADSPGVRERFEGLGIKDVYMKAGQKLPVLRSWLEANGLTPGEVAFVGDDIPDYECMTAVGLAVAPNDAANDIKRIAGYISPVNGGYGVARDFLEELLKARGQWLDKAKAFGW